MVYGLFCAAQDPYYLPLDKTKGLPSNAVYNTFQDSKGFVWVAHNEGLSRYDGRQFNTYTCKEQTSKAGSYIKEDRFGRIWYKNFDGFLYYVENDTMKALRMNKPTGFNQYAIMKNTLMVQQTRGIDFFDLQTLRLRKTLFIDLSTLGASLQAGNLFYLLLKDSAVTINENGVKRGLPVIKTPRNQPVQICEGISDNVFLLLNNQCSEVYNENRIKKFNVSPAYFQGFEYIDSFFWLCSPKGVYTYNQKGEPLHPSPDPFFPSKNVTHVMRDKQGQFWISTTNEGILLVPELNLRINTLNNIKPNRLSVWQNNLYIGSRSGKVIQINLITQKINSLWESPQEVSQLFVDTIEKLICFTAGELYFNKTNGFNIWKKTAAVKEIIKLDSKYYAIAMSGSGGLLKWDNKNSISVWDSLYNANIPEPGQHFVSLLKQNERGKSVCFNKKYNTLYFATNIGIFAAKPVGITELTRSGQHVYASRVTTCNGKTFALSTQGDLFEIYNNGTFSPPITGLGLLRNIKTIGHLILLINNNRIFVADCSQPTLRFKTVYRSVENEEINDVALWNNNLLIAVNKGLITSSFLTTRPEQKTKPGFIINKVTVNNTPNNLLHELSATENDVIIHYSVLNYEPGADDRLYYNINKGTWQICPPGSATLNLASLSPGKYLVEFRLDGYPAEQKNLQFSIAKAYWQQWWFIVTCAVVASFIFLVYYRWRLNSIKKQNNLLLEKIELEKNLGQYMLTAIKSQMNPHFFYNALNTIQSYIFSDNKKQAAYYLNKFSNLTRLILEMSEKETVKLSEEIKALLLYLELEKVRFDQNFNFSINIDKNIDTDMIRIPSMMVQPYVENAIKHGLLHKKGNKELHISFSRTNEDLLIEVSDNGIGRKLSTEINKVRMEKHHSFSTGANSKRLEILNRGRLNAIGVMYIDHEDENQLATGTTVKITIPIKSSPKT